MVPTDRPRRGRGEGSAPRGNLLPEAGASPCRLSFRAPAPHYDFHEEPGQLQDVTQIRGEKFHDENS
jgi:hypothetical protein